MFFVYILCFVETIVTITFFFLMFAYLLLDISELRRLGPYDSSSNSKQPFITCRVVVLKWLANLTHVPQASLHQDLIANPYTQHLGSPAMDSSFYSQISEKEGPLYMR